MMGGRGSGRAPVITHEQHVKIIHLRRAGMRAKVVAARLGVGLSTVYHYAKIPTFKRISRYPI